MGTVQNVIKKPHNKPKIKLSSKVSSSHKFYKELNGSGISYHDSSQSRSRSRGIIDLNIQGFRSGSRGESNPKKRRASHSRIEKFSLTNSFEPERKQSLQPQKKKTKTSTSQEISCQRVFKKAMHKEKRLVTETTTNNDDTKVKEMMSLYKSREYSEAIAVGRSILADNPTNLDALYIVGLSSSMLDRHEFTIKHFETLLGLQPTFKKNVYLFLSIAYKKLGKIEASFTILSKALRLFEDFFEAYVGYLDLDIQRKTQSQAEQTGRSQEGFRSSHRDRLAQVQRLHRTWRLLPSLAGLQECNQELLCGYRPRRTSHGDYRS
jgi:tetratricopeptide (TPR) repeat protein